MIRKEEQMIFIELIIIAVKNCKLIITILYKEGDYIFSRIGLSFDNYKFIGDINYLPPSSKYNFIKEVIFDFNLLRGTHKDLTMKKYLKQFGLNLYKIYDESVFDAMDKDGLDFVKMDELDYLGEFEDYLSIKMDEDIVEMHVINLSELMEFYFSEESYDLDDLLNIDLKDLLYTSIDSGLIILKRDLLSYIDTLKLYFDFLSIMDPSYEDLYEEISIIEKSPFIYIKHLNSYNPNFKIDRNLSHHIRDYLNSKAVDLLKDFDTFLLYMESSDVTLTKGGKIKRKDLFAINESLQNRINPDTKAPNQNHFINIDLFYNIALELKLLSISGNKMFFNRRAMDYFLLEDDEKYMILFEIILNNNFLEDNVNAKDALLSLLQGLNELETSSRDNLLDSNKTFLSNKHYLNLLGLIKLDGQIDEFSTISALGKRVLKYLKDKKDINKSTLVDIRDFK